MVNPLVVAFPFLMSAPELLVWKTDEIVCLYSPGA